MRSKLKRNYDRTVVVDAHIDRASTIMMIPATIVVIDIAADTSSRCRHMGHYGYI
jgi:hypothetical protein